MQSLTDQPLAINRRGEPVEQLGMARRFASDAEVRGRRDDPPAEMVLPDAIGHHPGRQRMVGPRDPLGQFETAARLARDGVGRGASPRNSKRGTPRGRRPRAAGIARSLDGRICGFALRHGVGARHVRRKAPVAGVVRVLGAAVSSSFRFAAVLFAGGGLLLQAFDLTSPAWRCAALLPRPTTSVPRRKRAGRSVDAGLSWTRIPREPA